MMAPPRTIGKLSETFVIMKTGRKKPAMGRMMAAARRYFMGSTYVIDLWEYEKNIR